MVLTDWSKLRGGTFYLGIAVDGRHVGCVPHSRRVWVTRHDAMAELGVTQFTSRAHNHFLRMRADSYRQFQTDALAALRAVGAVTVIAARADVTGTIHTTTGGYQLLAGVWNYDPSINIMIRQLPSQQSLFEVAA